MSDRISDERLAELRAGLKRDLAKAEARVVPDDVSIWAVIAEDDRDKIALLDELAEYRAREKRADALLVEFPILAGVTDEMVEAGARAAFDQAFMKYAPEHVDRWDDLVADNDPAVQSWRDVSRAALTTALGSRDADAPGDGGTT